MKPLSNRFSSFQSYCNPYSAH